MAEDPGIKTLLLRFPTEACALLAPDLLSAYGPPQNVTDISPEILPLDLEGRSRFLDVALLCTWDARGEQHEAVIVLVEHWSQARHIDLRRVNRYVAELLVRHPDAVVWPCVLVTDPRTTPISGDLSVAIGARRILDLRCHVVQTTPDWRERMLWTRNRVGAVLWVLAPNDDRIARCIDALRLCAAQQLTTDDAATLLAVIANLGKLTDDDRRGLLARLHQETDMLDIAEMLRTEGEVLGEARGKAELILMLCSQGRLTIVDARASFDALIADGTFTAATAAPYLARLDDQR